MSRLPILALALLSLAAPAAAASFAELIEERAHQVYGTEIPEYGQFEVIVEGTPGDVVLLAEFWMDLDTGRFLTNAVTAQGGVSRLSGYLYITVPVPVPNRRIEPGEILQDADFYMLDIPLKRVADYVVTSPGQLVGKEVARVLTSGRPVHSRSVIEPRVIERGNRVEIRFRDGDLALAAPGRALSDAHRGQDVRIVNLVSNKTVIGTATAAGIVEIDR